MEESVLQVIAWIIEQTSIIWLLEEHCAKVQELFKEVHDCPDQAKEQGDKLLLNFSLLSNHQLVKDAHTLNLEGEYAVVGESWGTFLCGFGGRWPTNCDGWFVEGQPLRRWSWGRSAITTLRLEFQ